MNRREFVQSIAAAVVVPAGLRQEMSANEWGSPVFDLHFHLRSQPAGNLAHLDGAGVTKANLLTRGAALEQVQALQAAAPRRFTWFNSQDVTKPDAENMLTAGREGRSSGFRRDEVSRRRGRSELRRIYALAADLRVPILIHFQEVDHFANEGAWCTGFAKTFESVLKALSEDDVHRACGCVLGQRECRLSQRGSLSDRPHHARRVDRQMAG